MKAGSLWLVPCMTIICSLSNPRSFSRRKVSCWCITKVTVITTTEMQNWKATSPFRVLLPCRFELDLLLSAVIGLNEESTQAG